MENTFIDALVRACSCRQQTRTKPTRSLSNFPAFTYHRPRRRNIQSCAKQATNAIGSRIYMQSQSTSSSVSRNEYMQLLDYYREPQDMTGPFTSNRPPPTSSVFVHEEQRKELGDSLSHSSGESGEVLGLDCIEPKTLEPETRTDDRSESGMCPPRNTPDSTSLQDYRDNLVEANFSDTDQTSEYPRLYEEDKARAIDGFLHLLEDRTSSHGQIYEAYCQLPSPGIRYMAADSRRLLFQRLSIIENKSKQAMLRYLRLVDDMKEASIPLSLSEWNTAIAYAGRCFVHVDALQVETALRIWKEMEQEAGIRSGPVTFNILFDIAAKAGKYVLAEMILKEMNERRLHYSRFSHTGFIYFHGLKGDGAGVRKAYRDLVEAGQIVDTVVMNCVIASLIRAGELPAAEQVYERMKRLFRVKTGGFAPNRDWRYSRDLGRILDRASRELCQQPKKLQRLQSEQCLAPNMRTFSILIDYHVHFTGELRRITSLLAEMQDFKIPIQGRIFIKIFRGFARHGGVKYTSWTTQRLEAVWTSLLGAVDAQDEGIQLMKWMVVWVVRAFARCCGRARALQIWEEIRDRWKVVEDGEKGAVEHLLRDILHGFQTDDDC
ncbi:MAG: hypothetical protein L6R38_004474 [Xanthoria sp. 2 TBL-2021]|nr:MAG: hypothetical protein L6R38_004474 [Xanthoria sp. 2 TBL-2021]